MSAWLSWWAPISLSQINPDNEIPLSSRIGVWYKFQLRVPTLYPRGGGNSNLGGRPDLSEWWIGSYSGWLTVAGQYRTLTGFAIKPSRPGEEVSKLKYYLIVAEYDDRYVNWSSNQENNHRSGWGAIWMVAISSFHSNLRNRPTLRRLLRSNNHSLKEFSVG